MIIIQQNGGLGNQMFQYACGRALAFQHKTPLFLDTSLLKQNIPVNGTTKRAFELDVFNIDINEGTKEDITMLKPLLFRVINVLLLKFGFKGLQISKYFIENKFSYDHNIKKVGKDCYLSGYWQSPKYFDSIASLIRDEFAFQKPLDDKNLEISNLIKRVNSVSLHIRRSDFQNTNSNDTHGICSLDYYDKAVEFISIKIPDPHFFVFSDDISWAKENLKLPYRLTFISGNNGNKSYIDMQMMSVCKHNIIANSSFSWWGAWLNSNTTKIVIAPKMWFANEILNNQTNDLIPEEWIRM